MDNCTRNQDAQRKYNEWIVKWVYEEETRDVQRPAKLDVPVLASFLQAIGFKLVSFGRNDPPPPLVVIEPSKDDNPILDSGGTEKKGTLQIAIQCDVSKMKAILELEDITCQCPEPEHVKEGSFWTITGTEPTANVDNSSVQKVEETGSNLLPNLSKNIARFLRDVSYKLFDTITCETGVSRTENNLNIEPSGSGTWKKNTAMIRSHTQPEIPLYTSNDMMRELHDVQIESSPIHITVSPVPLEKPAFKRQKTWDIETDAEPRPSPPKCTSSPEVIQMYSSLGQLCLNEDESSLDAEDYIIRAKNYLDWALSLMVRKKRKFERRMTHDLSPNPDIDAASVKSAPANASPSARVFPCKPTRSGTIVKPVSKVSHLVDEHTRKVSGNVTPINGSKTAMMRSKSTTRLHVGPSPTPSQYRRNSLYSPSPTNSTSSLNLKYSEPKLSVSRSSSKSSLIMVDINRATRVSSPQTVHSPKPETNNRLSLLKQPSKISKPIKPTSVQSKINTGSTKKAKDFSKQ